MTKMATISQKIALAKREKIQIYFWIQVGWKEHI